VVELAPKGSLWDSTILSRVNSATTFYAFNLRVSAEICVPINLKIRVIPIKDREEIKKVKSSSRILVELLGLLEKKILPGITTLELDRIAFDFIKRKGAKSAFKGYRNYPATLCTSVNQVVVHGIPSSYRLKEGDVVGVDVGVCLDHYYADVTRTFAVGEISPQVAKFLEVAKESLKVGISRAVVENHLSDISNAIENYVKKNGYSVVHEFVGHGVGRELHEEPEIPNFGPPGEGPLLKAGMIFAIEPMVNIGGSGVRILEDGWTTVTKDGKLSAHFEDTVLISENGPEILTCC